MLRAPRSSNGKSPYGHEHAHAVHHCLHFLTAEASDTEASLAHFDLNALVAELARRQEEQPQDDAQPDVCSSGQAKGSYNVSLHVAALVLILILSTLGTALESFR